MINYSESDWSLLPGFISFSIIANVDGRTGEACYGTNLACDYYSLSCAQDEIIRLGTLQYGRKEQPAVSFKVFYLGVHCFENQFGLKSNFNSCVRIYYYYYFIDSDFCHNYFHTVLTAGFV